MMRRLIDLFLDRPWLVLASCALLIIPGVRSLLNIPIDAFPDLTNNQVSVVANAQGMAAVEVEQLVTFPIESSLMGIPDTQEVRSISKLGLALVTVIFDDDVEPLRARQLVSERLLDARARLPENVTLEMGLLATPFGEAFQYILHGGNMSPMELKALHDWDLKYQLRAIPGVADVVTWGGQSPRFEIVVDPQRLRSFDLTLRDVFRQIGENNATLSAGFIEHASEQYTVRGLGRATTEAEIGAIVLKSEHGSSVLVSDVAEVRLGSVPRQGAVTANAEGETLSGMVVVLQGQNSKNVLDRVNDTIAGMRDYLPAGVSIESFYDQSEVIDGTIRTVRNNLLEGGLLVVLILFLALGDIRAAAIVALVIPLSMLGAFIGMKLFGVSANLMSLGAVDFGVVIAGAVVIAENAVRRMQHGAVVGSASRLDTIRAATHEVSGPVLSGIAILLLVYLPILTLQGLEGRMFRPMAVTVCSAVVVSLFLALFVVPTACRYLLRVTEADSPRYKTLEKFEGLYRSILSRVLLRPALAAAAALLLVGSAVGSLFFIGSEFMPQLDEGSLLIEVRKLPSVSLTESVRLQQQVEEALQDIPEITSLVSKMGRPDFATESMGVYQADVYVGFKPLDEWTSATTKDEMIEVLSERLDIVPGIVFNFTQPMAMRLNETVAGVRADVALKIFGNDEVELERLADIALQEISQIRGAADVQREVFSGAAEWRVEIQRDRLAQYGLNVADVQELMSAAIGGRHVTEIIQGRRRIEAVVLLPKKYSANIQAFADLQLQAANGSWVRLGDIAKLVEEVSPEIVQRENGQRRLVVQSNVRGRDLGSFAAEAQQRITAGLSLPTGYYTRWAGQFENQEQAMQRLMLITPAALLGIFLICYVTFGSLSQAVLVMMLAPFATVGGVAALWLRDMNLNVSAAIGFIAVFGIATIDGLVLVSAINKRLEDGLPLKKAQLDAAITRLRPVLMTSVVAALGLLPMATATSTGAEVQRPLATVVIGGVISSTALTLLLVPTFFPWFRGRRLRRLGGEGN